MINEKLTNEPTMQFEETKMYYIKTLEREGF